MKKETVKANFHRAINEYTEKRRKEVYKAKAYYSCDPIAMTCALDKEAILEVDSKFASIELAGTLTRGLMVIDWLGQSDKPANVNIVKKVNLDVIKMNYENMFQ